MFQRVIDFGINLSFVQNLIEKQKNSLEYFFSKVDLKEFVLVLEMILQAKGSVIFSGVGKSGHIAQKISSTFNSIAVRSFFLCPLSAMHGDLGYVTQGDVVILLSRSGESDELLHIVPHLRKRDVKVISVVSNPKSRLAKMSDLVVYLPLDQELCLHNLAPTNSTVLQLLFGDCIAVGLMQHKKIEIEDFAFNHPSGFLGRKVSLKVDDIMLQTSQLPISSPSALLVSQLHQLSAKKCGCLLVCSENMELMGIFTDGDLRRSLESTGSAVLNERMDQLMVSNPIFVGPDLLAIEAMEVMQRDSCRLLNVLPVVKDRKVVGLLRLHDLVQAGLAKVSI